jgi:ABC-type transporter Mla subunit MlaD
MQIFSDLDQKLDTILAQFNQLQSDADRLVENNRQQVQRFHDVIRTSTQQIHDLKTSLHQIARQQEWGPPAGQQFGQQYGGMGGAGGERRLDEQLVTNVVRQVLAQMSGGNASPSFQPRSPQS